jgi:5-methylcytosine-specific restriction endonuclease McrA
MNLFTSVVHKISDYITLIIHKSIQKSGQGKEPQGQEPQGQSQPKRSKKKKQQNGPKKIMGKKSIPKTIRNQVWRRFCGNQLDAKCFCCDQSLAYESWEAGHVVSEAKGGTTNVENLRPICLSCNRSMGKKHMFEFMKEYQLSGLKNIKEYQLSGLKNIK